ncbi:hypothetical protein RB595_000048 [Gaeumannomyces hyphopodioides]
MAQQLLPASAAAFAPRAASVNVVLGSKVDPWLTRTLKRINRVKCPLNSVPQHQRCLTETLSSPNAIWTLASLMFTKVSDSELTKDSDPLKEAISNYRMVHVEAYIVHVDMFLRNEVAYKLTPDTIDALIAYHKEVHCPNTKASTCDWAEKEQQCKKLHEEFIQAINKYVFRTHVSALEGLEEEGAGELLNGKSKDVKNAILGLMKPLLPPPPKIVKVARQPPLLPSSPVGISMWSQPTIPTSLPAPVESWRVLPSSPGVVSTAADSNHSIWETMAMTECQLLWPTPPFGQPFSSAGYYCSLPVVLGPTGCDDVQTESPAASARLWGNLPESELLAAGDTAAAAEVAITTRRCKCNHSGCQKSYKREGELDRHKLSHFKPRFNCSRCGRMFYRKDLLTRHENKKTCAAGQLSISNR